MAKIQRFTANLSMEGSTGSVRGKIPATLVSALGGGDGDVMEFEVNGKSIVGGGIITGREAQKIRASRQDFGRAPRTQAVPVPKKKSGNGAGKKVVGKVAPPKAKGKIAIPQPKTNKRKTVVAMKPKQKAGRTGKVKPRFHL